MMGVITVVTAETTAGTKEVVRGIARPALADESVRGALCSVSIAGRSASV